MNYPKVLYKGEQYTDYQQLSADIHSHKIAQVIIASEDEEADVRADGFGDLGDLMVKPEVKMIAAAAPIKTLGLPRK